MSNIISNKDLWNLPNERIAELMKGRHVRIILKRGEFKDVRIKNLLAAHNPPHLFVGFLTTDDNTIYLQDVDYVELL